MATKHSPKKASIQQSGDDPYANFACYQCGLIGHTQDYLLHVHLIKDLCRDPTGAGKCKHHYNDIGTFDKFIDCWGHEYDADMKGVCTLCCIIIQFKPCLGTNSKADAWHMLQP